MNVLSLFDGMSCGRQALKNLDISVDNYFSSEIDKYAIQVAQSNHPDNIPVGDVTKLETKDGLLLVNGVGHKIDLIIGGSPCQGFSFAGKQLNFDDPRSKLFFEFVRLKNELQPKYFLLENVKMKQDSQDIISDNMSVAPVEINSALVSAQNRRRLYWTNIPNITQPENLNTQFKDIMEHEATDVYRVTPKMMNWIKASEKRAKKLKIYDKGSDCKMQMLEASHHKGISNQRCFMIKDPLTGRMVGRRLDENGKRRDDDKSIPIQQTIEINENEKATNCISTVQKDNVIIADDFSVYRYISVIECERLQTLPDNYTAGVSKTQRYKMLGNGWTVSVIEHIFKNILDNTPKDNL